MVKLFVYGTLRKGEGNHHYLENATCIAEQCWTDVSLYDTGYGYPAMKQEQSTKIYGEIYSVSQSVLTRIDQLEGYTVGGKHNLYERIQQTVYTDNGPIVAYVNVANQEDLIKKKIPTSDWKDYRLNRSIKNY